MEKQLAIITFRHISEAGTPVSASFSANTISPYLNFDQFPHFKLPDLGETSISEGPEGSTPSSESWQLLASIHSGHDAAKPFKPNVIPKQTNLNHGASSSILSKHRTLIFRQL
ncbi:hypothetical protein LAG90_18465 [Marinilongibacter aquaticus]|uniref:hypothetical protein n=1 Tax=Marinilongibacter aquaticus TaxID=2975157 RepID=UPI0021BD316A|nr:hypothetical protein [Marinilongibacter aquaticus]UBM58784.1 hypothetical protein LAG90_18465 [Marinilongibacter aquaticus]